MSDAQSDKIYGEDTGWIQTFTGGRFFPLAPRQEDFDVRDVAHALSLACRYGGHVQRHYSVAEHCVRVSRMAFDEATRLAEVYGEPTPLDAARWGLAHDMSEAYLCDIPRPVKHQPAFAPYRAAEARLEAAVGEWLGLDGPLPPMVKSIDSGILYLETHALYRTGPRPDWRAEKWGEFLPPCGREPRHQIYAPMSPAEAEERFLARFAMLWPDRDPRGHVR